MRATSGDLAPLILGFFNSIWTIYPRDSKLKIQNLKISS